MAREPSCFFSDVVTRTKSSPLRANTVATAPLRSRNWSGIEKSMLRTLSPALRVGVATPLMSTFWVSSSVKPVGRKLAKSDIERSTSDDSALSNSVIMAAIERSLSAMRSST